MITILVDIAAGYYAAKFVRNAFLASTLLVVVGVIDAAIGTFLISIFTDDESMHLVQRFIVGSFWHPLVAIGTYFYFRNRVKSTYSVSTNIKQDVAEDSVARPLLLVRELTMDFGGLRAVDSITLEVNGGEIVALIGPNGAGKTTFFNCVTGIYAPTRGDIIVNPPHGKSRRINGFKPNRVTTMGMARTFQNIRLFPNMTVLENVMIGRHCRTTTTILGAAIRGAKTRAQERETIDKSYDLLDKVGLLEFADEFAKNLPYGGQRRLEIARAMATEPFLLLLDEPAAGMNPQETRDLDELIVRIRNEGEISILLIEHDMKLVMNISDRIYVMEYGKKIAHGTPQEIRENPKVIEAYLGEESDA